MCVGSIVESKAVLKKIVVTQCQKISKISFLIRDAVDAA
jgi:hypothetical protein